LEQVARDTRKEDDRANTIDEDRAKTTTNIEPRETGKAADEVDTLDEMLRQRVGMMTNIEATVDELREFMDHACRTSFRQAGKKGKGLKHESIPWWSSGLTIQRKEVNAKRRRYQTTKDNSELREQRKELYLASKAEYAAAIRQEKSKSRIEFCSLTSVTNPWSTIYKMAAGKIHRAVNVTTLRQQDGSHTTDLQNTIRLMVQKFSPDDNPEEDEEIHRQTRAIDTEDDVEFTAQEVKNAVQDMGDKKAPGGDGIPNEVWKSVVTI